MAPSVVSTRVRRPAAGDFQLAPRPTLLERPDAIKEDAVESPAWKQQLDSAVDEAVPSEGQPATADAAEHYIFGKEIGKGGFATVYKVKCKKTRKDFALKEVVAPDGTSLADLEAEVSCSTQLEHPNVLRLHAVFREGRTYQLVFDLCSGGNLAEFLREHSLRCAEAVPAVSSGLPSKMLMKYVPQMLNGLLYLHDSGFVHRDVKPHNFLMTGGGSDQLKLCDFGMCRRIQPGEKLTKFCGTPGFMAPEVAFDRCYDNKADVFSLGLTIFSLAADVVPAEAAESASEYKEKLKSAMRGCRSWQEQSPVIVTLTSSLLAMVPKRRPSVEEAMASAEWITSELRRLQYERLKQPTCTPCAVM